MALEQAGSLSRGATAYVTLEPCAHRSERGPACSDILVQAGIARVVIGAQDHDPRTAGSGIENLRNAGVSVQLVDHELSRRSLAGYLCRLRLGRPHVTLKIAMSLDGCVAMAGGESRWVTGKEARAHVHSRRAMADSILVGGGTWRADKPRLDVRLEGLEDRSPRRVVLTRGIAPDGVKVINAPQDIARLEDTQYLYVEGGPHASAAFIANDLVDRLEIYRAPIVIGGGMPSVADVGLDTLSQAHGRWKLAERRQLGSDTFEAYSRIR